MTVKKKVLITGTAGFIGFHLTRKLSKEGYDVLGVDNISGYYDISLKLARLKELGFKESEIFEGNVIESESIDNLKFVKADLVDYHTLEKLFDRYRFDIVINMAAQAGVRYSVENPQVYIDANIQGFINILELCRKYPVDHLVFASSSSVYGSNEEMPFSVHHHTDHPLSLYAATKKSNEMMAHSYSHLYNIPTTGLRFFTVYGPWGRPDMALFLFSDAIVKGKPIKVFNSGEMARDFTYIDDVVDGVICVINKAAQPNPSFDPGNPDPSTSRAPYRIYNIGKNEPVKLTEFIVALEDEFGIEAKKEFLPMQKGDVLNTYADVSELKEHFNFTPNTNIKVGIREFVKWYRQFYNI